MTQETPPILVFVPDDRVTEIFDTHGLPATTRHTITDRDQLRDGFEDVREKGYATDDEERILGIRCVAAPVLNDTNVLAAVSVSGAKNGMQGDRFREEIPELVQRAANVIKVNLMYK